MTYRQIYLAALRMLSENEVDGDVEDYEDRAITHERTDVVLFPCL